MQQKKRKVKNFKKNLEKIADGIYEWDPMQDGKGKYIPYCKFKFHEGLLDPGKAEICEQRNCWHYKRLYL